MLRFIYTSVTRVGENVGTKRANRSQAAMANVQLHETEFHSCSWTQLNALGLM